MRFGAEPRSSPWRSCLGHVPEDGERRLDDPGDVVAPGLIGLEKAGWKVDDKVHRGLVEVSDDGFFRRQVRSGIPFSDLCLDLGSVWPAEPGRGTAAVQCGIRRGVNAVGAGMPGVEDVPAPFVRRLLTCAALAHGAPVERLV